ncbi:MAG TPA: hypothetical protein VMV57_10445 [Terracidiphilus sp.]|nr:hypothetical protein [Terracidiphilus sp.]
MRRIALAICLAAAAAPGFAQERVTVDGLAQHLAAEHGRSDKDLAHRLENLQLTQRLSSARLETLEAGLPGEESRSTLVAVADLAEVLELPPGEIPKAPPPTAGEQQQMLARADAAPKNPAASAMPDFDCMADTTRFRSLKYLGISQASHMPGPPPIPLVEPYLIAFSHGVAVVSYRENRLFVTRQSLAWAPDDSLRAGADDWEGIYTLLDRVLGDMRSAQPEWVGWAQGPTGKLAVFRFQVEEGHAHWLIRTVIDPSRRRGFDGHPGYDAEIVLDPATGAVHRFVLRADLGPHRNVSWADVVVEFATVEIGGKATLAPLRAVTIGDTQSLVGYYNFNSDKWNPEATPDIRPLIHLVDVEFTGYRPGERKPPAGIDSAFLANAIQITGERVTVEQLEETVYGLGGVSDRAAAQRLEKLELTQRLTAKLYIHMRDWLPGKEARNALLALYDKSEFDDLPPTDGAKEPAPDLATQGKILTSAVEFVARITHKMPDLFATRQLTRFEDLEVVRGVPQPLLAEVKPLALVDQSTGTVHFRDGKEVVEPTTKVGNAGSFRYGLDTWGVFGPLLEIVMADVLHARIGWGHWEVRPAGRLAVLRYAVPEAGSHYSVRFCCYLGQDGLPSSYAATPGYHGELFIDPKTGEILRLVLKADLRPNPLLHVEQEQSPLLRSDVLVDYGAVDIAGKRYICPERTVSVMTSWTLGPQGPLKRAMSQGESKKAAKKALAEMEFSRVNAINEAVFKDYHVFRSEMRIVTGPAQAVPETPER